MQTVGQGAGVVQGPGKTESEVSTASDRIVTVKFDATVNSGLPWDFKPLIRRIEVRLGELVEVKYLARNRADEPVIGQAIPSVIPWQAASYFNKTECFCFRQQPLDAGESREMVLRFMVSPDLPEQINSLTLSYTFMNYDAESAERYGEMQARRWSTPVNRVRAHAQDPAEVSAQPTATEHSS